MIAGGTCATDVAMADDVIGGKPMSGAGGGRSDVAPPIGGGGMLPGGPGKPGRVAGRGASSGSGAGNGASLMRTSLCSRFICIGCGNAS